MNNGKKDLFGVPIIEHISDLDFYKITMMQAVAHQYPKTNVKYILTVRNKSQKLGYLAQIVRRQVDFVGDLRFEPSEISALAALDYMKKDFLDLLVNFQLNPYDVYIDNIDGDLQLSVEGLWYKTILWETILMSIISECHFHFDPSIDEEKELAVGRAKLIQKAKFVNRLHLPLVDMGTRRRYSFSWQEEVVRTFSEICTSNDFIGTSNVYLANKYGLKAIGTQAHEWYMAHLTLVDDIRQAQKRACHVWLQEYDDKLGIALPDTFTSNAFLRDFDNTLSRNFSGIRHDSGDPYVFGEKVITHYQNHGIDPLTKTIVFSDSLKVMEDLVPIFHQFIRRIRVSFGVGTDLTNDLVRPALNMVIKLSQVNGQDVVKLSDSPGKTMGNPRVVQQVCQAYGIPLS